MYNRSFIIGITCFKSSYKNAKCEVLNLFHLDPSQSKEKEIEKVRSILAKIVTAYENWNSDKLNVSFHISATRDENFTNADGNECTQVVAVHLHFDRENFYSLESLIRKIVNCMKISDPDINISSKEVFNDNGVKYFIDRWYNNITIIKTKN